MGITGAAIAQAVSYAFLFVLVYFTARFVLNKHFSELADGSETQEAGH